MVRRLNFTVVWRILWAGSRRIIDMQIRSVGIDLGKTTFHLVALGDSGKVLLKKKFTQKQLIAFTANMQTCLIGMEACSGSHFLGRTAQALRILLSAMGVALKTRYGLDIVTNG